MCTTFPPGNYLCNLPSVLHSSQFFLNQSILFWMVTRQRRSGHGLFYFFGGHASAAVAHQTRSPLSFPFFPCPPSRLHASSFDFLSLSPACRPPFKRHHHTLLGGAGWAAQGNSAVEQHSRSLFFLFPDSSELYVFMPGTSNLPSSARRGVCVTCMYGRYHPPSCLPFFSLLLQIKPH